MVYIILILLVGAIYLDHLHREHIHNRNLATKYRLYSLRDHLREGAIRGEIDHRNWLFQYLDSSISLSIKRIKTLTFWQVLAVATTFRRDESYLRFFNQLQTELNKEGNRYLKRVDVMQTGAIFLHLMRRHASFKMLIYSMVFIEVAKKTLETRLQKAVQVQAREPHLAERFAVA